MKKTALIMVLIALALSGCASTNNNYNSYDNRSSNERQIDNAISSEMNSLSDKDIAQLNKLK
jgi:uncharacterized protein YcfL